MVFGGRCLHPPSPGHINKITRDKKGMNQRGSGTYPPDSCLMADVEFPARITGGSRGYGPSRMTTVAAENRLLQWLQTTVRAYSIHGRKEFRIQWGNSDGLEKSKSGAQINKKESGAQITERWIGAGWMGEEQERRGNQKDGQGKKRK